MYSDFIKKWGRKFFTLMLFVFWIYTPVLWFFLISKNELILDFLKYITPYIFVIAGVFMGLNVTQDFIFMKNNGNNKQENGKEGGK